MALLQSAPDVRLPLPWPDPLLVNSEELRSALEGIEDLASQADVFDSRSVHPWRGFSGGDSSLVVQQNLESDLRRVTDATTVALESAARISPLIQLRDSPCFETLESLLPVWNSAAKLDELPANWWSRAQAELRAKGKLLEEAARKKTLIVTLEPRYRAIADLPSRECLNLLSLLTSTFSTWTRSLRPAYWRWRRQVRTALPRAPRDVASLKNLLSLASELANADSWLRHHAARLQEEAGGDRLGDPKTLMNLASQFATVADLKQALEEKAYAAPPSLQRMPQVVREAGQALSQLLSPESPLWTSIQRLDSLWPTGFVDPLSARKSPPGEVRARATEMLAAASKLHEWGLLQNTIVKCRQLGLGPFVDGLGEISAGLAPDAFARRFFSLWVSCALQSSQALATSGGSGVNSRSNDSGRLINTSDL